MKNWYVKLITTHNKVYLSKRGNIVEAQEKLRIMGKPTEVTRYFSEGRDLDNVKAIYESLGYKFADMVNSTEE